MILYSKNNTTQCSMCSVDSIKMVRVVLSLATGARCHNKESPLVCAVTPLLCLCC